jgi:glycosyltransferase involved in cell wall biosynthesis
MSVNTMVSVIIPTYNRPQLLEETLTSVKNQSFQKWECIVVNDGKDERTEKMVRKIMEEDNRFRFFQRPGNFKKGACGCRNFGFMKSSGKYIQWLDDDDLLSRDKLEKQVHYLEEKGSQNYFVTCDWDYLWPGKKFNPIRIVDEEYIRPKDFFNRIRSKMSFIPPHCYLTPRCMILSAGLWNSDLLINQDAEFFTRILINSERLYHVENCHVLYRTHDMGRISERGGNEVFDSLINSFRLIYAHLASQNFESDSYFKWKMLKLVLPNWKSSKDIFEKHRSFLKEIGIDLKFIQFYRMKYYVYQKVMPWYKRIKI